jgi:hypothetical protein
MHQTSSQEKHIIFAATTQFFVQTQCICRGFEKNILKKFDRENSPELAFESDENLSARKDFKQGNSFFRTTLNTFAHSSVCGDFLTLKDLTTMPREANLDADT